MSKEDKLQILKVEDRRQKLQILSTRLVKENRTARETHTKIAQEQTTNLSSLE
jgi:hypothetical protein